MDGPGGAFGGSRLTEGYRNGIELLSNGLTGFRIIDQGGCRFREQVWMGLVLQEFGHDFFLGENVHDAEVGQFNQFSTYPVGQWMGLIDDHHRHSGEGAFQGGSARGHQGEVAVAEVG